LSDLCPETDLVDSAIVGEPVQVQVINGRADPPAASTVGGVGAPVQYTMVPTTITTGGITVVVSTPSVAIQTATATSKSTGAGAVTSTTAPGAAGRAMATPFIGTGGLVAAVGLAAALW